jgi:4-hydroxymandelate synthase
MNVTAVDHVEFYVDDASRTARYLHQSFGFRCHGRGGPATGLAGQQSLLLGLGGIRLLVTSALAPDHPVARHVARHGDGVACVALRTADAAAAFQAAVGAGAAPVAEPRTWRHRDAAVTTATVAGPGTFTHRLVERPGPGGEFLPGAIEPVPPEPEPEDGLLAGIDHVALCVAGDELGPAAQFYQDTLGLVEIFQERIEVGDQVMDSKVVQSGSQEATFTIVAPDQGTSTGQLADFLRGNAGGGVQHLALSSPDITTAVRTLQQRGVRFLTTPGSYYDAIADRLGTVSLPIDALRAGNILVDRDHWGEMFQIFTESPFERRTFFFELIERHGALTFGTNNIRTLYEAKERARRELATPTLAEARS